MEQVEEVDARKMEPMEQVVGKKERPETVAGTKEHPETVVGMKEPQGPAVVGNELELEHSAVAGKTEPLEPLAADKKGEDGSAAGETEHVVDRTRSLVAVVAGRRMKQSVVDDL